MARCEGVEGEGRGGGGRGAGLSKDRPTLPPHAGCWNKAPFSLLPPPPFRDPLPYFTAQYTLPDYMVSLVRQKCGDCVCGEGGVRGVRIGWVSCRVRATHAYVLRSKLVHTYIHRSFCYRTPSRLQTRSVTTAPRSGSRCRTT